MIAHRMHLASLGKLALPAAILFGATLPEFSSARAEKPKAFCDKFIACVSDRNDDGPPAPLMTVAADDVENLQLAIWNCWNVETLSTRAQQVALVLRVEMDAQGKPKVRRITMISFSGGEEDAASQSFEAARRAVIRSQKGCRGQQGFAFDPAKYTLPGAIEMTFDTSGMRLR